MKVKILKKIDRETGWFGARMQVVDEGEQVLEAFFKAGKWRPGEPPQLRYGDIRARGLWEVLMANEDDRKAFPDGGIASFDAHYTADGGWCDGDFMWEYNEALAAAVNMARQEFDAAAGR